MPLVAYLRDLNPHLPPRLWVLEGGAFVGALGRGAVLPFTAIYLHNVRGFSLATVGVALALLNALAFVTAPIAGSVIDRIGARATLIASLALLGIGYGCFPLIHEPWQAFLFASIAAAGVGALSPSHFSLLEAGAPRDRLHSAYAVYRMTDSLGVGLGAAVGGLIAAGGGAGRFTALYLLNAAAFAVFAGAAAFAAAPTSGPTGAVSGGYRQIAKNRPLLALLSLNVAVVAVSYGLFETLLPLYARNDIGVSAQTIGLVFLINPITIVVLQLPVTKALEGRRRMGALAGVALLWAAVWLLIAAAGAATFPLALAVLIGGALMFAVGEAVHVTVQRPLVADLAPPEAIGRYAALSATSLRVGLTIGPALGGLAFVSSPALLWLGAAAICVAAAGAALALEPRLPDSVRRTPVPAEPSGLEVVGRDVAVRVIGQGSTT